MDLAGEKLPWIHPVNMWLVGGLGGLCGLLTFLMPKGTSKSARQHVVITGGSSGIGLALAHECVRQGFANITLIARNKEKLEKAKKELLEGMDNGNASQKTKVRVASLDVTDPGRVKEVVEGLIKTVGPPDVLFNNAGTATARSFADTTTEDFAFLLQTNYLGVVCVTKAFLPSMVENGGGTIVLTSSMAGLVGVFGYTAYTPTKFALRGFAESLQMETRRDNISVVLAYPPDTDTPGYKTENKGKPMETQLISETAGLYQPEIVAKTMVAKCLVPNPPYCVYFGLEGWMLSTLSAGMSPVHSLLDAVCQVLLMGILRLVSLFYLWDFTRIIAKCGKEKKD